MVELILLVTSGILNVGLAVFLFRSNRFDGYVELEEDPGGVKRANLVIEGDPETLLQRKKSIRFGVKRSAE